MHPYHKAGHKNDPKWVDRLPNQIDAAERDRIAASKRDAEAALRNYGGDAIITDKAAYAKKEG